MVQVQRRNTGGWHRFTAAMFRLNKRSRIAIFYHYRDSSATTGSWRIRTRFLGRRRPRPQSLTVAHLPNHGLNVHQSLHFAQCLGNKRSCDRARAAQ